MIEVRVDFNARGADGLVKASLRRATGELREGLKVLAVDADEDMAYVGEVDSIDEATGRVWLKMHWDAATPSSFDITHTSAAFVLGWNMYFMSAPQTSPVSQERYDDELAHTA